MYSTVDDMLRWAAAFERPEFSPLLSRMQQPGTLKNGSAIANGYGMGLSREPIAASGPSPIAGHSPAIAPISCVCPERS